MRSVRVGDVAAAIDAARNPPQDPKAPATTGSAPARDDATTSLTYPPEFQPAAVWQYTRNGTVAGIGGGVDLNLAVVAAVRWGGGGSPRPRTSPWRVRGDLTIAEGPATRGPGKRVTR